MKNKKIAALLGILLTGSMAFSLSACGNSNDSASDAKSDTSTSNTTDSSSDSGADDSSNAGFEEIQVDEKHSDQDVDALTVNAVYFQPIDMEPSGMGLKLPTLPSTWKPTFTPTRRAPSSATARATSCRI